MKVSHKDCDDREERARRRLRGRRRGGSKDAGRRQLPPGGAGRRRRGPTRWSPRARDGGARPNSALKRKYRPSQSFVDREEPPRARREDNESSKSSELPTENVFPKLYEMIFGREEAHVTENGRPERCSSRPRLSYNESKSSSGKKTKTI